MRPTFLTLAIMATLLISVIGNGTAQATSEECKPESIFVSVEAGQALASIAYDLYTEIEYGKITDRDRNSWHWYLPRLQGHVYSQYLRLRGGFGGIAPQARLNDQMEFVTCDFPYLAPMLDLAYSFFVLGETSNLPLEILQSFEAYRLAEDEQKFSISYQSILAYSWLRRNELPPEMKSKIEEYFAKDVQRFKSRREFFSKFEQSYLSLQK